MVTPSGRVVILDFGLITELFPERLGQAEQISGGTPARIARRNIGRTPLRSQRLVRVGATLYESLTGHLPFKGDPLEVLLLKREVDPPAPADLAPEVPADLNAICCGLLCRDPARRLSGREALSRLGSAEDPSSRADRALEPSAETPFVGRKRELELLDGALRTVGCGRAAAIYVSGPSGIGKTALVRSFLARVTDRPDVVVLAGRCYEHESVPYKALDGGGRQPFPIRRVAAAVGGRQRAPA